MSRQTTIQVPEAIRKGSVRVLVGDDFDNLVDIGALRNPSIAPLSEAQRIEFDNADGLDYFVKGDRVQATFDLAEINLDTIAVLDAGMVNLTTVAAALVSGASQVIAAGAWNFNTFIAIANQNGDKTAITVNSLTLGTDGALVEDTDFYIGQNENGVWGVFIIDSATVTTENQTATIDYDYTPNASKQITPNATGKKIGKCMRLINIDNAGKEFYIDIENGTNKAPMTLDFAGDEEEDVAIQAIDFQGTWVKWVDEQQTA